MTWQISTLTNTLQAGVMLADEGDLDGLRSWSADAMDRMRRIGV